MVELSHMPQSLSQWWQNPGRGLHLGDSKPTLVRGSTQGCLWMVVLSASTLPDNSIAKWSVCF